MTEPAAPPEPADLPRLSELLPRLQAAGNRFALGGAAPILTFYALYRLFGPTAGIAGGMAVSLVALAIVVFLI